MTKPSCKLIGFIKFDPKIAYILLTEEETGMNNKITGVIMAGGKSSRMGTDKGLLLYQGKPLAQYSIDILRPFCSEMLISTHNPEYSQFGLPLVQDVVPGCGPMGGIYSAFMITKAEYLLVLACDMPFVSNQTLEKLLENRFKFDCIVPVVDDKMEPLCAIYSSSLLPNVESRINAGNLMLRGLIMESNHRLVNFDDHVLDFRNINTPEEFERNNRKSSFNKII
jgi:molybdopterin-guanine dinucleotide biosynthesis protein A